LIKILVTAGFLVFLAAALYRFNLFDLGFSLIPFILNLLLMGWAVGMVTTALIIRWGHAAEALAWGVPFLIQPLAAVFYPVAVLPRWAQGLSLCIPATHVFEGMRQVLAGGGVSVQHLVLAGVLNLVWLILGALFVRWMFELARRDGLLAKLGTQ